MFWIYFIPAFLMTLIMLAWHNEEDKLTYLDRAHNWLELQFKGRSK